MNGWLFELLFPLFRNFINLQRMIIDELDLLIWI